MRKTASRVISLFLVFLFSFVLVVNAGATGDNKQITAKALVDHECNSSEWHFVITQIGSHGQAPATIKVKWANGAQEVISKGKYTGKTAHYTTYSNLNSSVTEAYTHIYKGWSGQFNLSHGPCGKAQPTASPTVVPTPSATPTLAPTASPTAAPTGSPTVEPINSPSTVPSASPTVDPTAEPTPTNVPSVAPTATPVPTVEPTIVPSNSPRTDLTDGRSDGRKDSLDCVAESQNGRKDCSEKTVTPVVAGVSTDRSLPTTGAQEMASGLMALAIAIAGYYLKLLANKQETTLISSTNKDSETRFIKLG